MNLNILGESFEDKGHLQFKQFTKLNNLMQGVVAKMLRAHRLNVRQVNGNAIRRGYKYVIYDSIGTRGTCKILKTTELNKRGNSVVDAVIRI